MTQIELIKAEIERKYAEYRQKSETEQDASYYLGMADALDLMEQFIDSLPKEQPSEDLEKEIDRFWDSCIKHKNENGGNVIWSNKIEIEVLARHFYELGRNAGKEDEK